MPNKKENGPDKNNPINGPCGEDGFNRTGTWYPIKNPTTPNNIPISNIINTVVAIFFIYMFSLISFTCRYCRFHIYKISWNFYIFMLFSTI